MKISEFYTALTEATEKLGIEWHESAAGQLRAKHPRERHYCPITAVCAARTGARFYVCDYRAAAGTIGLDQDDAARVARAADTAVHSERHERTKLKRSMGLSA